jgi:hypothetical protein
VGVPDGNGNVHAGDHGEAAEGDHGEEQGLQPRHPLYQVERSGRTKIIYLHNVWIPKELTQKIPGTLRNALSKLQLIEKYHQIPT